MKVQLETGIVGNGFAIGPGEVVELEAGYARRLIAAGSAIAYDDAGDDPAGPSSLEPEQRTRSGKDKAKR